MTKPSTVKIAILVIISILLFSAIGFTGYYYFNYSFNAGRKEVADFKDMNIAEIKQYLIDNNIKEEYVVFEEAYDEEIEVGKVISQSIKPLEGQYKDILTIVISKGYDPDLEVELPEIDNFMQADIEDWFEENHFSNILYQFIIPEESDEEIPYGKVIGLSKLGLAKRSEEIIVFLADEKPLEENENEDNQEDEYITIVDFKGYSIEQFAEWTHGHGLKYYVYEVYSDDYKKGEVISQSPKAKEKAKKGSTVTLRMSLGQAKKMENLIGKTASDAEKYAKENEIKIKTLEEFSRTYEKGKIIKTSPAAGEKYTAGDTLIITISKGSDLIKLDGSYVGKTESELLAACKAKYASVSFSKTETYSTKASNTVISHDSEISILNKFKYTVSLGPYSDSSNYAGKTLKDVKNVIDTANSLGANVKLATATEEKTTDSAKNNVIKSCSFANNTYSCTVYKYIEPQVSFVANDFKNYQEGNNQQYQKDGYTFTISIKRIYTDGYTTEAADTFNSATCSSGNVVKNGSTITIVLNKGPKPVVTGGNITWNIYSACEIPDDNDKPTYEKVKNEVISKLTSANYGYTSSQINCIPDETTDVGYINIEDSSQGQFIVGEDTIKVYIGTRPRGE